MINNVASVPVSKTKLSLNSIRHLLENILNDSASAWSLRPQVILMLWAVPFIISISGIVVGLISKDLYKWFIHEDGLMESAGVGFYALTFIGSLLLSRQFYKNEQKLLAFLYAGLSLAMLFMVGEELGWGQRIFNWQTPESFNAINKQSETTLHNIYGVEEMFRWLQMLVGAYGTVLPLAFLFIRVRGRLGEITRKVVPHYSLIPYFAFIFLWKIFRVIYPNPSSFEWAIAEYNEVMEFILALGFFLFIVYQVRSLKNEARNIRLGNR